jgi:hypothetical protein
MLALRQERIGNLSKPFVNVCFCPKQVAAKLHSILVTRPNDLHQPSPYEIFKKVVGEPRLSISVGVARVIMQNCLWIAQDKVLRAKYTRYKECRSILGLPFLKGIVSFSGDRKLSRISEKKVLARPRRALEFRCMGATIDAKYDCYG